MVDREVNKLLTRAVLDGRAFYKFVCAMNLRFTHLFFTTRPSVPVLEHKL